jgi:hypothetical protein
MSIDPVTLAERYVAMWNEPDPDRRRAAVRAIWTEDGANLTAAIEARGYGQLDARAESAHQRWIVNEQCRFRLTGTPKSHHGLVLFIWEMFATEGGAVISTGTDVFVLADDGRVKTAYTFVKT